MYAVYISRRLLIIYPLAPWVYCCRYIWVCSATALVRLSDVELGALCCRPLPNLLSLCYLDPETRLTTLFLSHYTGRDRTQVS